MPFDSKQSNLSKIMCPCDTLKLYSQCCGRYHDGNIAECVNVAPDALSLMRSRYSAFVLSKIDYLENTMRDWALHDFNAQSSAKFCASVSWHGLKILNTRDYADPHVAEVEFIATYQRHGFSKLEKIHERSLFNKIDGAWYYVSSIHDVPPHIFGAPHVATSVELGS